MKVAKKAIPWMMCRIVGTYLGGWLHCTTLQKTIFNPPMGLLDGISTGIITGYLDSQWLSLWEPKTPYDLKNHSLEVFFNERRMVK